MKPTPPDLPKIVLKELDEPLQHMEQYVDENHRHWVPLKEASRALERLARENEEWRRNADRGNRMADLSAEVRSEINHWKDRAEKAEAERDALKEKLGGTYFYSLADEVVKSRAERDALRAALEKISKGQTSGPAGLSESFNETCVRELAACRDVARATLQSTGEKP